jgi:UDP-N-acetylmuramate dehydrogenase
LITKYPFVIQHNVPLSKLSTFGIGGNAENYIPVQDNSGLISALDFHFNNNLDFMIIGGGSNTVFSDEGIKTNLLHVRTEGMKLQKNTVIADSGVSLDSVINFALENGLQGLENLSGIPGTIGGAVVGNAGAYGKSISESVRKIFYWHEGKTGFLENKDCRFGYRDSVFKHEKSVVLQVILSLKSGKKDKLKETSTEIKKLRSKKYKPGIKCPGSFFKNILVKDVSAEILSRFDKSIIIGGKIPAGYLLTQVGARGMRVGGIVVSDFHGNLLINNEGNGTAKDVKKLAGILKEKIFKKFGTRLEEEVRYF